MTMARTGNPIGRPPITWHGVASDPDDVIVHADGDDVVTIPVFAPAGVDGNPVRPPTGRRINVTITRDVLDQLARVAAEMRADAGSPSVPAQRADAADVAADAAVA